VLSRSPSARFDAASAVMPVVTAVIVVCSRVTLALQTRPSSSFKPTIIYVLFGVVLLGGLAFGKSLLAWCSIRLHLTTKAGAADAALGAVLPRVAVLNEIVLAHPETDVWVRLQGLGVVR